MIRAAEVSVKDLVEKEELDFRREERAVDEEAYLPSQKERRDFAGVDLPYRVLRMFLARAFG